MSLKTLSIGIFDRWNNASLNSSIATLYPGGDGESSSQNKTGAPESATLPRAEYYVIFPRQNIKTRGSRVYNASAMITVRGVTKELVDNYISLISDAFLNSDEAGTSPLVMSNGSVLEVDDGGAFVTKVDDALFEGVQTILIQCRINNAVPA